MIHAVVAVSGGRPEATVGTLVVRRTVVEVTGMRGREGGLEIGLVAAIRGE